MPVKLMVEFQLIDCKNTRTTHEYWEVNTHGERERDWNLKKKWNNQISNAKRLKPVNQHFEYQLNGMHYSLRFVWPAESICDEWLFWCRSPRKPKTQRHRQRQWNIEEKGERKKYETSNVLLTKRSKDERRETNTLSCCSFIVHRLSTEKWIIFQFHNNWYTYINVCLCVAPGLLFSLSMLF